jgi:hypothetical protein
MEPATTVSMTKDALSLKLETPFMVVASLSGWLGVLSMSARDNATFRTPSQAFSKLCSWLGWKSGAAWFNGVHMWMNTPARRDELHFIFLVLVLGGIACTAVGTRSAFVAMFSIGGLVEVGATTAAWVAPLLALIAAVTVSRLLRIGKPDPWDTVQTLGVPWMLSFAYLPMLVVSVLVGERDGREPAKPVVLELSRDTVRVIDERLRAFGMPSLVAPVPGRHAHRPIGAARREVDARRTNTLPPGSLPESA